MEGCDANDARVGVHLHHLCHALITYRREDGFAGTIRDIAERADVAYVTFFRHYKSKDELLNAI